MEEEGGEGTWAYLTKEPFWQLWGNGTPLPQSASLVSDGMQAGFSSAPNGIC